MTASHPLFLPAVESALQQQQTQPAGRQLFRNTAWSCLGSAVPMLVALVAVPKFIHTLGPDRFGILGLAWMAVGYLSLLDFGLGRAITRMVAERLKAGEEEDIPGLFWDANLLLVAIGAAGGILTWAISALIVHRALRIPPSLQGEAGNCFRLISATIPVVVLANGLRGFLEAYQKFRPVNVLRVITGMAALLIPLLLLHWTARVDAIVGTLCAVRAVTVLLYFLLCVILCPQVWSRRRVGNTPLAPLLRFGGWITVDNLVGPLMVSVDRLIIGSLLSVGMTTYYITPQEMLTKLLILPMGLQQAIFPAFSKVDRLTGAALYRRSIDAVLLLMIVPSAGAILFARDLLTLWLGAPFASQSYVVFQWLAVGILINSVAHVPSSMLQAIGRPEWNAVIHLCELPPYLFLIWALVHRFGIAGAAAAWVLRVSADTVCFLVAGSKVLPGEAVSRVHFCVAAGLVLGSAACAASTTSVLYRSIYLVLAASVSLVLAIPLLDRRMDRYAV